MRNVKMTQIHVCNDEAESLLKGKTIANARYSDASDSQMIITFTDNTYIALDVTEDEVSDMYVDMYLETDHQIGNLGYIRDGKLVYYKPVRDLLALGIITLNDEEIEKIMKKKEFEEEQREFNRYIALKAKFKNKEQEMFDKIRKHEQS